MKNYQMGIDISKEKLNICLRKGTQTVREEEIKNTVSDIKKCVKRIEKENSVTELNPESWTKNFRGLLCEKNTITKLG